MSKTVNIPVTQQGDYARLYMGDATSPHQSGTLMFDISTKYGQSFGTVCTNLDRAAATAIIEHLQAAFPKPKPFLGYGGTGDPKTRSDTENAAYGRTDLLPVPEDVVLPDVTTPTAVTATVDGRDLVLTQWLDFRGWEVRKRARSSSESGMTYGWLYNVFTGHGGATARNRWQAVRDFKRIDDAIRWLVSTY